jgi:homospermidine synthase
MTGQFLGRIDGPIVMIGFGSIGRGTLPLILRHFNCDRSKITIIDPDDRERRLAERRRPVFRIGIHSVRLTRRS